MGRRRELKIQEGFVYQLAETNRELESENTTQGIVGANSNDRGRALQRGDSDRTGKRHPVRVIPRMDLRSGNALSG